MKITNEPIKKTKYDEYVRLISLGSTLTDVDPKICEGIRQRCYQKNVDVVTKRQDNGLYSLGSKAE